MSNNFPNIRKAQTALHDIGRAIEQNEGLPELLAPHAVRATANAVAPLRELEGYELPDNVKDLGRRTRDAAQAFADDPNREKLSDWRVLVRQLATAFSRGDLRAQARASDHVPGPPAQKIDPSAIYPGMAAAEARGVPSIPFSKGGGPQ